MGHFEDVQDCILVDDVKDPWLRLDEDQSHEGEGAIKTYHPGELKLPGLREFFGALAEVGLLPTTVAMVLEDLDIQPGGTHQASLAEYAAAMNGEPEPVDVLSDSLEHYSFRFQSIRRDAETGEKIGATGVGSVTVDLKKRRVLQQGTSKRVSAGLPEIDSSVLFQGDLGKLYSRIRVAHEGYDACRLFRSANVPTLRGRNPFALAFKQRAMQMASSVLPLGPSRSAEFQISQGSLPRRLEKIILHDRRQKIVTDVTIEDWSTAPPSGADGLEEKKSWHCQDQSSEASAGMDQMLLQWDFISVLLGNTPEVAPEALSQRRLITV